MDTIKPTRRPHVKRAELRRTRTSPFRQAPLLTPEMLKGLELWGQVQPLPPPAPQFVWSQPAPEKPLGEILFDFVIDVYKEVWKKTDPDSYNANQAIFALAPYWPSKAGWILNVGAVGTALYGFRRVAERAEKATEANKRRGY
ncbi:MAG: hypothetical protein QOG23_2146 [Blastocatellia bacterium]|nr:hypothetical protein [Blastocatellia bacterium]